MFSSQWDAGRAATSKPLLPGSCSPGAFSPQGSCVPSRPCQVSGCCSSPVPRKGCGKWKCCSCCGFLGQSFTHPSPAKVLGREVGKPKMCRALYTPSALCVTPMLPEGEIEWPEISSWSCSGLFFFIYSFWVWVLPTLKKGSEEQSWKGGGRARLALDCFLMDGSCGFHRSWCPQGAANSPKTWRNRGKRAISFTPAPPFPLMGWGQVAHGLSLRGLSLHARHSEGRV